MSAIGSERVLLLFWLFSLYATTPAYAQVNQKELVARGQYIFAVSGGCACHTAPKGVPHTGARAFQIPLGTVYSTNLTSDNETGLGSWTDQQILDALTKGLRKDGTKLHIEGRSIDNESICDFVERLSKLPYVTDLELRSVEDTAEGGITVKKFVIDGNVSA